MNAAQYCLEHSKECLNGRISFTKPVVDKFINLYTYLEVSDFDEEMYKRLRLFMIDLYNDGYSVNNRGADLPVEKIELPNFVLCIRTKY